MAEISRGSGILLHITSLPGPTGIGTLGTEATQFADFLAASGQSYWQVLPFGPVSPHLGFSPYASPSTFAGNDWFISLQKLQEENLVKEKEIPQFDDSDHVPFAALQPSKSMLLREAAERFFHEARATTEFEAFCNSNRFWLDDYALFMALAEDFSTQHWPSWEPDLARRNPNAMAAARDRHSSSIRLTRFTQFCFFRQWFELKRHCARLGIRLIGDIPYYVTLDGADTWSHPQLFALDPKTFEPANVAGVPPDYFSADGQRWGNPLYRWFDEKKKIPNEALLLWWRDRLHHALKMVDILRLDHFRGFASYWAIPSSCPTAREGKWLKGPGEHFFLRMQSELGPLPLIAEDLGIITPDVETLRERLGFPGMKVLQFAFAGGPDNPYLPHNYTHDRCLVYTGTHDNNTTNGWFFGDENNEPTRRVILDYLGTERSDDMHWQMIRLAMRSNARVSIFPMQDILGYGPEARMNIPGQGEGNWRWKMKRGKLDPAIAIFLRRLTHIYNRISMVVE